MQFISRSKFLTTLGTLLVTWGSYQDTGLGTTNNAELNNKTAVNAGVNALPNTDYVVNLSPGMMAYDSSYLDKKPEAEKPAVVTRNMVNNPVMTPVVQPVAEEIVVSQTVDVLPAAASEKKRQAAFTNDYDQFMAKAEEQKLFHDFARQLPLNDHDRAEYAITEAKTYGELEKILKQSADQDEIDEIDSILDDLAGKRAVDYYFDKRDGTIKSDADYLAAMAREQALIAKAREAAQSQKPVASFMDEYKSFYQQPQKTKVVVQPMAVDSAVAAPVNERSVDITADEASGWVDSTATGVDSVSLERNIQIIREETFAPTITQPAVDAIAGLLEPAPGEFGPPESSILPIEPLEAMSLEGNREFVGPRLYVENTVELENIAATIQIEPITPLNVAIDVAPPVVEKLNVTPENVAALSAKTQNKIKLKKIFKPVYKPGTTILSEDSVADASWRARMPYFVRSYRDSLSYAFMKQKGAQKESSNNPLAVNKDTKAAGLWAMHPVTQQRIARQLGVTYPKGKAALTKDGILTQSLYKTQHDQNTINALHSKDLKRQRQDKMELSNLDCVIGTKFNKQDKPTLYKPVTFDDITMAAGLQAGEGFIDFLYSELDRKLVERKRSTNPNVRNAPIVFDKLYTITVNKKDKKTGKRYKKTYKQDFYQFMTDVAQDPAKKEIHFEMAQNFHKLMMDPKINPRKRDKNGKIVRTHSYSVEAPMYTKESSLPNYVTNRKAEPADQVASITQQVVNNMPGAQRITQEIHVDTLKNRQPYQSTAEDITIRRVKPMVFSSVLRF